MRYIVIIAAIISLSSCKQDGAIVEINADFPGGNIILDSISNDTVYIRPDNRDSEKPWFYWYFEVKSTNKNQLIFKFNQSNSMSTFGPAYSRDRADSWNWLFTTPSDQDHFTFNFETNEVIRFCMAMPYLQSNFERFCDRHISNERFKLEELDVTRAGRKIEKVRILPITSNKKAKVLITARHHASEMMANYIMEGIVEEVLAEENLEFASNHVEWIFIPFMDKDGVERGDQGKHRIPRDHNRDYGGESIYASTRSLRDQIPVWLDDLPLFALDLHNPWIKYDNNEITYIVGSANSLIEREQMIFTSILDSIQIGLISFNKGHFMPFGTAWNTNQNYEQGLSFSQWASQLPKTLFAGTLETPYGNNEGQQVTSESSRSFGRDIARAINVYLEEKTTN